MYSEYASARLSTGKRLRRRLAALTMAALAVTGLATVTGPSAVAGTAPTPAVTAAGTPFLYVAGYFNDTVTAYNTATGTVAATIPTGSGTSPREIAVTPDGRTAYVSLAGNGGGNQVSVINTVTNTVTATVTVGLAPFGLAVTPNGAAVYVGNSNTDTVSVISTATNTVTATITVGSSPFALAITPDGSRVYTANRMPGGTVSVIDTATNTVSATIPVGGFPDAVAITPNGATAYIANLTSDTVSVISTATNTVTATIPTGSRPFANAVSPDGTRLYVANLSSGTVSVVDTATNTVVSTIAVGSSPDSVAFSLDGAHAYVANRGSGSISVIDTATATVTSTISGITGPYGLATTNVPSPPAITAISPSRGPQGGGTTVTITGSGFTGTTAVAFGGITATSFTVVSDTQITATAPAASSLGTVDVRVINPSGTSPITAADQYTYVNNLVRVQGAGRIPVGTHAGEFGIAAERTQPIGPVGGHLEFEDQADGVHLHDATFSDLYQSADGTAHTQGTASCTINGITSPCAFTVTAAGGGKGTGSFTLTYNSTTVGGTILSGHVTVTAIPPGMTRAATTRSATSPSATPTGDTPVAAATTGTFAASLLGVNLTGGQCGTGADIAPDGTATGGQVSCLLLGTLGVNITLELPTTSGTTAPGTAALSGTATVVIGGALPLPLPATATLTRTGPAAGLRLTVAGVPLPVLPVGTGGIEIG